MLLLLDLVLKKVDSAKKLLFRLNWLRIAEPECVHLNLLEL